MMNLVSRRRRKGRVQLLAGRYPQYRIGSGTYGDINVLEFGEGTTLTIGKFCCFAHGVTILLGGNHRPDWVTMYPFSTMNKHFSHFTGHPRSRGNVVIGNDVWVGREAMILSGVTIGDGAVIGARAFGQLRRRPLHYRRRQSRRHRPSALSRADRRAAPGDPLVGLAGRAHRRRHAPPSSPTGSRTFSKPPKRAKSES